MEKIKKVQMVQSGKIKILSKFGWGGKDSKKGEKIEVQNQKGEKSFNPVKVKKYTSVMLENVSDFCSL